MNKDDTSDRMILFLFTHSISILTTWAEQKKDYGMEGMAFYKLVFGWTTIIPDWNNMKVTKKNYVYIALIFYS